MTSIEEIKCDRDALAVLGLFAHAYLTWDPAIPAGFDQSGKPDFTHFAGLNIQALMIDNTDGEVLAIEKNGIHAEENPLAHAEQRTLKSATVKIKEKRPRMAGTTVEGWYRNQLFYEKGTAPADFVTKGSTLYTTLEPCPFCTTALCVSRVKRVVFLTADRKFGNSWDFVKQTYYKGYDLDYGQPALSNTSIAGQHAITVYTSINEKIDQLRQQSIQDTWFLDHIHNELRQALDMLSSLSVYDLYDGDSRKINQKTLLDLKQFCKLR